MHKLKTLALLVIMLPTFSYAKTLASVAISPQGATIQSTSSQQFTALCTYSDSTTDDCTAAGGATWSTSTAVLHVDSSGLASGDDPVGNGYGYTGGFIVVTAGGLNDRAALYAQHPGDAWYQYITPDFHFYSTTTQVTNTLLPPNVVVGSTVTIGSGFLINNSGGASDGNPMQDTCNWTSSDATKATVSRLGLVTAIAPGSVNITCGRSGNANFQSSALTGWVSPGNVITLTIVNGGTSSQTWYVRPDGGQPYVNGTVTPVGQCTGKVDAAYPGPTGAVWHAYTAYALNDEIADPNGFTEKVTTAGTSGGPYNPTWPSTGGTVTDGTVVWTAQTAYPVNQACAMGNLRYLWTDMVTYESYGQGWMISGGDTVIVRQNAKGYDLGQDNDGTFGGPSNCVGAAFGCYMPTIPSGTSVQHTRILGENYASCTSDSSKTLLFDTWSTGTAINTRDSQFVDVSCFEITDKSACANGNFNNGCVAGDSKGTYGVWQSALTASVNYTDLFIHGLGSAGIVGASGVGVVANRIHIRAMPSAGINMDDAPWQFSNISVAGGFTLENSITEFTGCVEEYPVTHTYPYIECEDQNSAAGYADGLGTASATGDWVFDHDTWRYNYQDGLDLLHSGLNSLAITNSTSYGNEGQQFKIGSGKIVTFQNNLTVHNCLRVGQTVGDEPTAAVVPNATNTSNASTSSLSITWDNGLISVAGNGIAIATTGGTFTMVANATNYFWVDPSTFTVMTNTTGFPTLPWGSALASIVTNGAGMADGGYVSYNPQFGLCRASGEGIVVGFDGLGTDTFQGNTFVGYGETSYQLICSGGWDSCPNTKTTYEDNIDIGLIKSGYNSNQAPGLFNPGMASMPPNSGWAVRDHNLYYGFKGGCPTLLTGEVCSDALFISAPFSGANPTITSEQVLDNFNFNLATGSPAKFTGVAIAGLTTDNLGNTKQSPPSMGGLEYQVGTLLTVTVSPSTASLLTGNTTTLMAGCSYSNGDTTPCTVTWTDTNTHSSVGSSTGVVTGISVGSDTITATMNSIFGTATVTMTAPPPFYTLRSVSILGSIK